MVPGDVWFDYKRLFCFVTLVESERRRYVLLRSPLEFLCSRLRDSKNVFILFSREIDPLGFNSRDKCARQRASTPFELLFTSYLWVFLYSACPSGREAMYSKLQCVSFDPAYSRNALVAYFDFLACMRVRVDDNSPCVQIPYF